MRNLVAVAMFDRVKELKKYMSDGSAVPRNHITTVFIDGLEKIPSRGVLKNKIDSLVLLFLDDFFKSMPGAPRRVNAARFLVLPFPAFCKVVV